MYICKMNLLLDDIRDERMCFEATGNTIYLTEKWIIVRSYDEFCNFIKSNKLPTLVSLDHDLADYEFEDDTESERDGKDCLQFMIDHIMDNDLEIPNILVHSSNTPGRVRIQGLYDSFVKFHNITKKDK